VSGALAARRFDRSLVAAGLRLSGRVEAVWSHAAFVGTGQGPFVTLLHPSRSLVPFGVEIPWQDVKLAAGEPVVLEERCLRVGVCTVGLEGEGVALEVSAAPVHPELLRQRLGALALPERSRGLLSTGGPAEHPEERAVARIAAALEAMVDAIARADEQAMSRAAAALCGLGPGSTPTGDDVLAGVTAMGLRLGRAQEMSALLRWLAQAPSGRTTVVGAEMLRHASQGRFPEALVEFVKVLGDPAAGPGDVEQAGRRLGAVGGQTGFDMLAGAAAMARGSVAAWASAGRSECVGGDS